MTGNVYVFNCYSESIGNLVVGNAPAGSIAGWTTSPPPYTPASRSVPRALAPGTPGAFAPGSNTVVAQWPSGPVFFNVAIPGDMPINQDFILYLTRNQAILQNAYGVVVGSWPGQNPWGG